MGIDVARFREDIDGDLICPICSFVLEDPIQAPICEHVFCNTCITEWLTSNQTCPIDRTNLTIDALKPAPRILRNFLSRLTLSCSNQTHGCSASLTLERLAAHLLECNFNPKRPVTCQSGCGITILFEEYGNHNCIQSLKNDLAIVQKEQEEQEEKMSKMQSELDLLKAEIDALKKVNQEKKPTSSDLQLLPTVGQSQAVNQEVKEKLSGSGCPLEMVKTLIENSNESRWPPGIRSKEARRANQDQLKDYRRRVEDNFYVLGRIRNTEFGIRITTVGINVIMASDNAHMDQDLFVINPGFLVLSSHFW
ncbi:E3 ubiquitin-protein ligase NRDP1-like isoform X3 [Artemia franciscana]|uniref:E3 ubiquitin-protein ligase NRDP1-like isoform X3 n=1 Tax=Artemia franciscana TaxID=6661 RepID=UPI0032DB1A77